MAVKREHKGRCVACSLIYFWRGALSVGYAICPKCGSHLERAHNSHLGVRLDAVPNFTLGSKASSAQLVKKITV